jgi:tetratricopeptide (TPR) repeat protein
LDTAIEPAVIWAQKDSKNLEAQITTAAIYIRLNQIDNALPFLRLSEQLNAEETFQYFLILFRQLSAQEDNGRVVSALERLAKEETKYPSAHLALAEIYFFQNDPKKALQMSEGALKIDPNSVVAAQLYTQALARTQGKEPAKAFLEKTVSTHPDNNVLKQYYAQFLLENGYSDQAKHIIEDLIKNPNLSTETLIQFARQSLQAHWYPLADQILQRTSKIAEQKDLSYYLMARSAEMQNQEKVAIEWYKQVLTGPFHALSQIRASLLLSEKGDYKQALAIISRTQPSDEAEKKQLALAAVDILGKTKEYTQAIAILNDQLTALPDDPDLLYARSLMADKLGQLTSAETDLKTILDSQPNHIDALNALGYLLSNKTNRYSEALTYLSKAHQLAPKNASVLDSLGWLYYKMGDYKKSIHLLKQAVEIMPDAEISAHLGEVLWHTKDFEGAKKVWNSALEQHPKQENVLNAMQ